MKRLLTLPYEVWRDIKNYDGLYQISNIRRVMNIRSGCILKPILQKTGYLTVTLCKNGVHKTVLLHRIIAEAFIPNPDNLPEVDHINRDRTDNNIENLQWCTHKGNMNNPLTRKHISKGKSGKDNPMYGKYSKEHPNSKPIIQFDLDGNSIREWDCTADAVRKLGILPTSINNCLKNRSKTAGGYIWKYKVSP